MTTIYVLTRAFLSETDLGSNLADIVVNPNLRAFTSLNAAKAAAQSDRDDMHRGETPVPLEFRSGASANRHLAEDPEFEAVWVISALMLIDADEAAKAVVLAAITNAVNNGYGDHLRSMSPDELTMDIMDYDADVAKLPVKIVKKVATAWLSGRTA